VQLRGDSRSLDVSRAPTSVKKMWVAADDIEIQIELITKVARGDRKDT
jgi:hypothetical protein